LFKKILIANRGEIAMRVMRACREMGIDTVAVYSEADRRSSHVRYADEAVAIGPPPSRESYLNIERVVEAARSSGAEAVHPGYGFLAENPAFARAVAEAGLVFIGPPPEAMERVGSKTAARDLATAAGLPVVPGAQSLHGFEEVRQAAERIGFPVMLKAAAGGGGMGMRAVDAPEQLKGAWRDACSEAYNAFGDDTIFVEKLIERPRHVEIQILGDRYGNLIHLGERECSLQRRHQKLMEECPSPAVDEELRRRMGETAVRLGQFAGYWNAGTVEFLLDSSRNFYFLEVNTRLQVEHPVTEMVTGIDLVQEQIRIAAGERLRVTQREVARHGTAIECRISAEDRDFFPSPGLITAWRMPEGPGVRNDSGVYEGWHVPLDYDPLMAKLIVWGRDRAEAVARLRRALPEYEVDGVDTTIPFFRGLLHDPQFLAGHLDTGFVSRTLAADRARRAGAAGASGEPASADQSAKNGTGRPAAEAEPAGVLAAALEAASLRRSRIPNGSRPPNAWKRAGREAQLHHWPR
jgi:acetyl-CoA carboxylase, biotin carboxylase subunit